MLDRSWTVSFSGSFLLDGCISCLDGMTPLMFEVMAAFYRGINSILEKNRIEEERFSGFLSLDGVFFTL